MRENSARRGYQVEKWATSLQAINAALSGCAKHDCETASPQRRPTSSRQRAKPQQHLLASPSLARGTGQDAQEEEAVSFVSNRNAVGFAKFPRESLHLRSEYSTNELHRAPPTRLLEHPYGSSYLSYLLPACLENNFSIRHGDSKRKYHYFFF